MLFRIRQGKCVESRVLEVYHTTANQADEMMVTIPDYLEARRRAWMADFASDTNPNECL